MNKAPWMMLLFCALALVGFGNSRAEASQDGTYEVTGQITDLQPDHVVISSAPDGRILQFERNGGFKLPPEAKVGDRVTVWYRLDAQKVKRAQRQEAGQVAPKPTPLRDDRAFYPA